MISQLNHYEALGVSQFATQAEIRSAYKSLVLKFHPDKNEDKETATIIFNRVQEAYEVLNSQESRNQYDMSLYIKSMVDEFSMTEETASTVFDTSENYFEGFGSTPNTIDSLKDILEEKDPSDSFSFARSSNFDFEEYQCFREFMNKVLLQPESTNVFEDIARTQELLKGMFCQEDNEKDMSYKQGPKINSRSHKISKEERPKARINRKH